MTKRKPLDTLKDENTISDLSKRFLLALEIVGYTAYRVAKEVDGINQQTFVSIRSGRNLPSIKVLNAFLKKFPTINGHWMLTGEGDPQLTPLVLSDFDEKGYKNILHKIPIEDLIDYIKENEVARGFSNNNAYNLFLETRTQSKLIEKMNALEARMNNLSATIKHKNKEE